MNEKKGMFIRTRDLIIIGLAVVIVFYFAFEIFKIKHQMKFGAVVDRVNAHEVWIQNVNRSAQQAQQRAIQQQQIPQPEKPKKEGK